MSEERTILKAIIGIGLTVYVLLAVVPLVHGHTTPIAGSDVALPVLLLAWCVFELTESRR